MSPLEADFALNVNSVLNLSSIFSPIFCRQLECFVFISVRQCDESSEVAFEKKDVGGGGETVGVPPPDMLITPGGGGGGGRQLFLLILP